MKERVLFLNLILLLLSNLSFASEHSKQMHSTTPKGSHTALGDKKNPSFDEDDTISMPMGCLSSAVVPCVFKSLTRQTFKLNGTQVTLLPGSVVKILSVEKNNRIEPLSGGFIIDVSEKSVFVKAYELVQFPSYVVRTKDQVEIIDGKDFYLIKMSGDEKERVLLDKVDFVSKLAQFFSSKIVFRVKLKEISSNYDQNFKQDVAIQKKRVEREIASIKESQALELEKQKAFQEQKKKDRQYFFKRTFER